MSPLVLTLLPLPLLTGMAVMAFWIVRWQRERLAPSALGQPGVDGAMAVPIIAARLRGGGGFGGMSRNSINPTLALTRQGLAFKVLRQQHWAYGELQSVHVAKGLFGPTLDFKAGHATLNATVRDLEAARQALHALPRTVPLTKQAIALRDDGVL